MHVFPNTPGRFEELSRLRQQEGSALGILMITLKITYIRVVGSGKRGGGGWKGTLWVEVCAEAFRFKTRDLIHFVLLTE